jgi:hypothetical protein
VIPNFMVLERGVPRLGTGISQQRGGDNVASDTWIFPLLVSYDEPVTHGHYVQKEPFGPLEWVTEIETYHQREKSNATFDHAGAWAFFFAGSSTTCTPEIVACPGPLSGGA